MLGARALVLVVATSLFAVVPTPASAAILPSAPPAVVYTVTGRVVLEDPSSPGSTVPATDGQVEVSLFRQEQATNGTYWGVDATGMTAADGSFSIQVSTPASYQVQLSVPGSDLYGTTAVPTTTTIYAGAVTADTGMVVERLKRVISGTVTAGSGSSTPAAANITMEVLTIDGAYSAIATTATAAADGSFTISGLPAAVYRLTFSGSKRTTAVVSAVNGDRTGLVIPLAPQSVLSGRVLVGPDNVPAVDVGVNFGSDVTNTSYTTHTDDNGYYTFPAIAVTVLTGTVSVAAPDSHHAQPEVVLDATTAPGDITQDIHVRELPTFSGHVQDQNGVALSGIDVRVDEYAQYATSPTVTEHAATDASGDYSLPFTAAHYFGTAAVRYTVSFTDPTAVHAAEAWDAKDRFASPTVESLAPGQDLTADIVMPTAATLSGAVTSAAFRASDYAATTVTLQRWSDGAWSGGGIAVTPSSSGAYTIGSLPPGTYRLKADYSGSKGRGTFTSDAEVLGAGDSREVALPLHIGPSVKVGAVIRFSDSPTLYLLDSATRIVPLASTAVLTDGGHSTHVTALPAWMHGAFDTVETQTLSNLVACGGPLGSRYLATGSRLRPAPSKTDAWPVSVISTAACASFPHSSTTEGSVYVGDGHRVFGYQYNPSAQRTELVAIVTNAPTPGPYKPGGTLGSLAKVNAAFLDELPKYPAGARVPLATLVEFDDAPTIYLEDSYTHLIPLQSLATMKAGGLSTGVVVRPHSERSEYTIDADPLRDILVCDDGVGDTVLLTGGKHHPGTAELASKLPTTLVSEQVCTAIARSAHSGAWEQGVQSLVRDAAGAVWYLPQAGARERITAFSQEVGLYRTKKPLVFAYEQWYVDLLTDWGYAPGALVRVPGDTSLYLLDVNRLVPVDDMSAVRDAGISTTVTELPSAPVGRAPAPLGHVLECGTSEYLAGSGAIAEVDTWDSAPVGIAGDPLSAVPHTALDPATCAAVPHASKAIQGAPFIKSGTATYQVAPDGKHRVLSSGTLVRVQQRSDPLTLVVSSSFAAQLPTGAPDYDAGLILKGSSSTRYLLDGEGGRIPVRTLDQVRDMGFTTGALTVSNATRDSFTVQPAFTNFVDCAEATPNAFLVAGGFLIPVDSSVVGSHAVAVISASLCTAIAGETNTVEPAPSVLVVDRSTHVAYQLSDGAKHKVTNWSKARIGRDYFSIGHAFLGSVPTGADLALPIG